MNELGFQKACVFLFLICQCKLILEEMNLLSEIVFTPTKYSVVPDRAHNFFSNSNRYIGIYYF